MDLNLNIKAKFASQDGFVLVAAVMALMIFIAVGFYALTVTTQDLRVSASLVGERKAFSAAEAGVNMIMNMLDTSSNLTTISGQKVDPTNDPKAEFSAFITRDTENSEIWLPGYSQSFKSASFRASVTGRDTGYGSRVRISVGMAGIPGPPGTEQGP